MAFVSLTILFINMNYLAHLHLSGNNEEVLFGNFIGDHVKGSQLSLFSADVQKGIRFHRWIDSFTDSHELTTSGKERLRRYVHKYAPVALDIIYDHYLAVNWMNFHTSSLKDNLEIYYGILDRYKSTMPLRAQQMYGYMRKDDWLWNYIYPEGVLQSLIGLSRRTRFESGLKHAFTAMMDHYDLFQKEFMEFFPLLKMEAEKMREV